MTRDEKPEGSWHRRETQREECPGGGNGEDLRNIINRLGMNKELDRYKARPQTLCQSRTRKNYELYSRKTDPNEHHKRRHDYDTGPSREHELKTRG